MDIELCAQTVTLLAGSPARLLGRQIAAGLRADILSQSDADVLTGAARLYWQVQAAARLLSGGTFDPDAVGAGGRQFVLRETGFDRIETLLPRWRRRRPLPSP